jgi:hypothetical protein
MTKIIWIFLGLVVVGDALFVLPFHASSDSIVSSYFTNFKKDTELLYKVFPDTTVFHLKLNMPERFKSIYKEKDTSSNKSALLVNVAISHNLDFTAVSFPFYKRTNFNAIISFSNIIKLSNIAERDSTALIGNIVINGRLKVKGICTPLYARLLVEKELVDILTSEMNKIEQDINWHRQVLTDSTVLNDQPTPNISRRHSGRNTKKP